MAYFLLMTWPWWLLTVALAVLIIWLIFRNWLREKHEMQDRIAELEAQLNDVPALKALVAEVEAAAAAREAEPEPDAGPDLDEASAVLGYGIDLDDLAVIEGIGPKIRGLLLAEGIRTWRQLAGTDVARLHGILHEAGPHYRIHDPSTWPRQAELLADGEWERFKEWTDILKGGREVAGV